MSLTDAQARWMVPAVFDKAKEKIERGEPISLERFNGTIRFIDVGMRFTDPDTNQELWAFAAVLISESEERMLEKAQQFVD